MYIECKAMINPSRQRYAIPLFDQYTYPSIIRIRDTHIEKAGAWSKNDNEKYIHNDMRSWVCMSVYVRVCAHVCACKCVHVYVGLLCRQLW